MKRVKSAISLVGIIMIFSACMDYHSNIALIKNNTPSRLLIAIQPFELMTDSTLYNERFDESYVEVNQSQFKSLPNIRLSSQPKSAKCYLYVFNSDSVHESQTLNKMEGIVQHTLLKKMEIQLNEVKEPLDTIYIK